MAVAVMGQNIRLDRFLTDMGKGTRSQIKEAAKSGRIQVNGQTVKKTDQKIDPQKDAVLLDGREVSYHIWEYFLLNKPQGVVSATRDDKCRTVIDLLEGEGRKDLFPVGRLDKDTEGLLLLTNDGSLAHRLLSPKRHVDKQYYAQISSSLPPDAPKRLSEGITLADGTRLLPARLEILGMKQMPEGGLSGEDNWVTEILLTIQEGKFHQVKRMISALGGTVVFLKRLSMGPLKLDETLAPGQYRRLTGEEIARLKV